MNRQQKAILKSQKQQLKASDGRNWFARHKALTVILALVLIGIVAGAGGGSKKSGNNPTSDTPKTYKFADRADKQDKDVEVAVAEPATVDGRKMTISSVQYLDSLGEFSKADAGKTFAVATVEIENVSEEVQTYNSLDFRIQTAGGQVLDASFESFGDKSLGSGDIVAGGKANGNIVFEVPVETGSQYVIWKPNAVKSDRAVVKVK